MPHLSADSLGSIFPIFREQLLSLLGVPEIPSGVRSIDDEPFSDWQLDALMRLRTRQNVENSKDTLTSIVALVKQIENMPVGHDVKGDVQSALDSLSAVRICHNRAMSRPLMVWLLQAFATSASSLMPALRHSSEALSLASRAFFNPGMLALLYFPAEHKYAVYTPLFASVAAPLIAAVLREIAAWRKARRARLAATDTQARTDRVKID